MLGSGVTGTPRGTRLPAEVDSFVGRSALLGEGARTLERARLVTLIGAGGVGKTRLLERLGARVAGDYDTTTLVYLAGLKAGDDRLESTIAAEMGLLDNSSVPAMTRLIEYLRAAPPEDGGVDGLATGRELRGARPRERRTLLLLDNCEHLVGDRPGTGQVPEMLNTLLRGAPGLTVVATSREKLGAVGEHLLVVPPLCAGDGVNCDASCVSDHAPHEALQLLVERARAIGVEIPPQDYPLAARLCDLLDGLPLNIELAAGQLDTMTLREMVEQRDPLRLLVDGVSEQRHHRSLRATLDWSYDLLGADEKCMWALASVFEGGFDLEAAQAVCRARGVDDADVQPRLARLKRKSLLVVEQLHGRTRYRMLETIRQYGRELVESEGLDESVRLAHAEHYATLVDQASTGWFGPEELTWIQRVGAEQNNVRAAQDFYLSDPATAHKGLKLAVDAARSRSYIFGGSLNEARRLLTDGLNAPGGVDSLAMIAGLSTAAWLALIQGNQDTAAPLLALAESAARELDCQDWFPPLLYARATRRWLADADPVSARAAIEVFRAAEQGFREAGSPGDAHMVMLFLAMCAAFVGDRATAFAESERVLESARSAGARWAISWALWACALAELVHGEADKALLLIQEALRIQHEIGDTWGPAWSLWLTAIIAVRLGEHELGATLFGAANAARKLTNASVLGLLAFLRVQQGAEGAARRALGDDDFEDRVERGEKLSPAKTMELALEILRVRPTAVEQPPPGGLSKREFEVVELIGRGMENKVIGEQLGISTRTVERHVGNINQKLNKRNRLEIASWYGKEMRAI